MQCGKKKKNRKGPVWQVNNHTGNQAGDFRAQGCECRSAHVILFGERGIFAQQSTARTAHEERILNSRLISTVTWENWLNTTLALMWAERICMRQRETSLAPPQSALPSISSVFNTEYIKITLGFFLFFFLTGASRSAGVGLKHIKGQLHRKQPETSPDLVSSK